MIDDPVVNDPVVEYERHLRKKGYFRRAQEDLEEQIIGPTKPAAPSSVLQRMGAAVGRGVTEGVASMADTAVELGQGAVNATDKVATWLGAKPGAAKRLAWGDEAEYFSSAKVSEWNEASLTLRGFKDRMFPEGKTWWEGAVSGISQFAAGMVPGAGAGAVAMRGAKAVRGSKFLLGAGKGAVADFAAFDPDEARLADITQNGPAPIRNTLGALLAPTRRDADDSRLEGRFKQAAEGFITGSVVEGVIAAARRVRGGKAGDKATVQAPEAVPPTGELPVAEQAPPKVSVVADAETGGFRVEGPAIPKDIPKVYATEAEAQSVASVAEAMATRAEASRVIDDDTARKIWAEYEAANNGSKDIREVYEDLKITILNYTGTDLAKAMKNIVGAVAKVTDPSKETITLGQVATQGTKAAQDGLDNIVARGQARRADDASRRADGFALKLLTYANADMAKHYADVLSQNPTNELAMREMTKFLNNTVKGWQEFRREGTAQAQNLVSRKAKVDDLDRMLALMDDADLPEGVDVVFQFKDDVQKAMTKEADDLASAMSDLTGEIKSGAEKASKAKAKAKAKAKDTPPQTPADGVSYQTPNRDLLPEIERELDDNIATRWGDDLRGGETPTSRPDNTSSVGVSVSDRYKARIQRKIDAMVSKLENSALPVKEDGRRTLIRSLQEMKDADFADLLSQDAIDDVLLGKLPAPPEMKNPLNDLTNLLMKSERELAQIRNPKQKQAKGGAPHPSEKMFAMDAPALLDELEADNPINSYWQNAQKRADRERYNKSMQGHLDRSRKKTDELMAKGEPAQKPIMLSRAELIHMARAVSLYKEDPGRILAALIGERRIMNQAEQLARKSPEGMSWGRVGRAVESWRVNAMLSGIPTTVLQTVSSTMQAAMEPAALIIGGLRSGDKSSVRFGVNLASASMDVFLTVLSMGRRNPELWSHITDATKQAWQRGEGVLDSKTSLDVLSYRADEWGPVAAAVNTPTRLLTAVDEFNKQLHYAAFARAQATSDFDDLVKSGLAKADEAEEAIAAAQKMAYNLEGTGQATNPFALDWARRQTFTTPLDGNLKKIQDVIQAVPFFRQILPFFRTPVNIYSEAAQYAPGLGMMSKRLREELASPDPIIRSAAMGKQAIGYGMMATTFSLVSSGMMTGNGPSDPRLRKQWEDAGNKQYTIRLPGGAEIQYRRMEPVATVLGIFADSAELWGELDEAEAAQFDDLLISLVAGVLSSAQSKSFLTTVSDLFDAFSESDSKLKATTNFIGNYAGSFVPALVNNANKSFLDDELKASYFDDFRNILDKTKSRIPGFSKDVEARRNIFGEPVLIRPANFLQPLVWPMTTRMAEVDPVMNRLVESGIAISAPPKEFGEAKDNSYVDLTDKDRWRRKDGKVQSPYDRMQELLADRLRLREQVSKIVMSDQWENLPKVKKEQMVKAAILRARNAALKITLTEYVDLAKATKLAKLDPLLELNQ